MTFKEKEMKSAQIFRADSTPRATRSAVQLLIQRIGLTILACTLIVALTSSASANQAQDEAAVRALGDSFANAFVQKDASRRASLFTANGTFLTPVGHFLQGHVEMVKEFGPEAQQAVTTTTQAAFSNYRIRFIKTDIAVADASLTVRNVTGPDGKLIPVVPINFFYVASRHGDKWLIEDGRAHFAAAPVNGMTAQK
jgi:uncharacterized protein (TIGR02246 family)